MVLSYLKKLTRSRRPARRATRPGSATTRPRVRQLEDRTVLATLTTGFSGHFMAGVSYTAGAGVSNNLTLAWSGTGYTFTDTAETITVTGLYASDFTGSGTHTVSGPNLFINWITIDLGDGLNWLTLEGTGVRTTIANHGGGTDMITLGSAGASSSSTLADILGAVSVSNASGSSSLHIYDGGDTTARTVSVSDGSITGLTVNPITWTPNTPGFGTGGVQSLAVCGGSGGTTWNITNTSAFFYATILQTEGNDTVNVLGTTGELDVNNNGASDNIIISNGMNTVSSINGLVDVYGTGASQLLVVDSGDQTSRAVTLNDGSLTGLAPAPIDWSASASSTGGVIEVSIDGGSGGNTWNILNTSNAWIGTVLWTPGSDTINVEGTTGGLTLQCAGPSETVNIQASNGPVNVLGNPANPGDQAFVNIGSAAPALGGTVANIKGPVRVEDGSVQCLTVDDSGDSTARRATLGDGYLSGLAPATIDWQATSSNTGGVVGLTVYGGVGGNMWDVSNTSNFLNGTLLQTGSGSDTVNVQGTTGLLNIDNNGGSDTVTVGSMAPSRGGTVANILGTVSASGPGATQLAVDDSGDTMARTATLGDGCLVGLAPATIDWQVTNSNTGVVGLTVYGGSGGNTWDVPNTSNLLKGTLLQTGGGNDTVNVQATTGSLYVENNGGQDTVVVSSAAPNRGGTLAAVAGLVDVFGPGTTSLTIDDSGDKSARTATLTASALIGLSPALIDFTSGTTSGVTSLTVDGGAGGNTFTVQAAPLGAVTINGGPGSNTLVGPNWTTTWNLWAANGGNLANVNFSAFQYLVGGNGVDTFKLYPWATFASIDGGGAPVGQGDWLNYSAFPATRPVTVNLATGSATNVGGGAAGAVKNVRNVVSGAGKDTLIGDSQGNILIGGGGNDIILGGSGRSLLIGGTGGSTITGGSSGDILIAGTTTYDSNHTALMLILKEWQRTDKTYTQRIADLKNGGGYNGGYTLNWGTTVLDSGTAADTLTGGAGLDWFFANMGPMGVIDKITDLNNGGTEQVD
jgi:hypothetical protein